MTKGDDVRDPTVDPKPGDLLTSAKNGRVRTVTRRAGREVYYRPGTSTEHGTNQGRETSCWLQTWQEWCRINEAKG